MAGGSLTPRMITARRFLCTPIWINFFRPGDVGVAHEALRDWLWEQPQNAQPLLARLSPAGRATMEMLMARQIERLRPQIAGRDSGGPVAIGGDFSSREARQFARAGFHPARIDGRHHSIHGKSLAAKGKYRGTI